MRRLDPFAWLLLASLAAAPAGAAPLPRQFDLDCAGTRAIADRPPTGFRGVFHVDLASNRFCRDDCDVLRLIADVTPQLITLERTSGQREFDVATSVSTYAPETRQYRAHNVTTGGTPFSWRIEAQCEVRRFTPFPANAVMRED